MPLWTVLENEFNPEYLIKMWRHSLWVLPFFYFRKEKLIMIKKTITYTDYNGNELTEDFYFNLTKAELTEMNFSVNGGLAEMINKIIAAKNEPAIIKIFKEIILKAYGEKSADGKRFMKSEEIATAFSQTEAYVQLFMELATDSNAAANFVNGIIPSDYEKSLTSTKEITASGTTTV